MFTLQGTACPGCGAASFKVRGRFDDLTLLSCRTCTLTYTSPPPRERVRRKYVDDYDLAAHFDPMTARKRVLYEGRLARLPRPAPGVNRLCDVGCGDGQFLAVAAAQGWDPSGIELNPPAAQRAASRGAQVRVGVLEELDDLPWGTFDLVTSWDVLEHTPDPRPFAERLVRLLAPGGTLALTTLNFPSLAWRAFGVRWSMVVEDHFTYWNRRSLLALFEPLGLQVDDIDVFGLGRDFVAALDRHGPRRAAAATNAADSSSRQAPPPGWDVNPWVLRVEAILNRAFRRVGGGVGIGLVMRKAVRP